MLVHEEQVLIGTDTPVGHVYAFDKSSGDAKWRFLVDGTGAPTDILQRQSRIYTVVDSDEVVCLNAETGELVWGFKGEHTAETELLWTTSAALSRDRLFFGAQTGHVYGLDSDTGDVLWVTEIGARVSTSLVAHGDDVSFGAADGRLYRLSQATGNILAQFFTERVPVGRPTLGESAIYFFLDENDQFGPGKAIELAAMDLALDNLLWIQEPDFTWTATKSHIWNNTLLTGSETGELVAYDLQDGSQKWTYQLDGTIRSMNSFDNTIYVGTLEGMVHAVKFERNKPSEE